MHFYRTIQKAICNSPVTPKIDNTPEGELVRATTGYAFDLVGERRQADYRIDEEKHIAEESFEIKVANHRKEPVQVRVWEHPCRWRQWQITTQSHPFKKLNQKTFEFAVPVAANAETKITYTIRYDRLSGGRR